MKLTDVLKGIEEAENNQVHFDCDCKSMLVLDKDSFDYNNEVLFDEGQAHRAFLLSLFCMYKASDVSSFSVAHLIELIQSVRKYPFAPLYGALGGSFFPRVEKKAIINKNRKALSKPVATDSSKLVQPSRSHDKDNIVFELDGCSVLIIDENGMFVGDSHITDINQAHKEFIRTMKDIQFACLPDDLSAHERMSVTSLVDNFISFSPDVA